MFIRSSSLTLFPIYLLPSIPFRRRKASRDSTDSSDSNDSADSTDSTINSKLPYLSGHTSYLRCAKCSADICLTSQIVSKGFTGRHGRAYLVSPSPSNYPIILPSPVVGRNSTPSLPNTKTDASSSRQLVTGIHTVADVRCVMCMSMLGWKYEGAEEESQKYKVGKYILETKMVCESSNWELGERKMPPLMLDGDGGGGGSGEVEFDSQDEDECEDLFAGIWSRELAARRRERRAFRMARGEGAVEG